MITHRLPSIRSKVQRAAHRLYEPARLLGMAVGLTWRASPWLLSGILLLVAVQAAMSPLELLLSKTVVDRAALDLGIGRDQSEIAGSLPLVAWILLAAGVIATGRLIQPFLSTFQSVLGDRLTGYFGERIILAANNWKGLSRFEDPSFADDLSRARQQTSRTGLELMMKLTYITLASLTVVGLAITLASLHPLLPAAIILATLPQIAQTLKYSRLTAGHLYVKTPDARRMQYLRDLMLTPEPAKDIRLFDLGGFLLRRYDDGFQRTVGDFSHQRKKLTGSMSLASALAAAASAAVYVYVAWRAASGSLSVGDLILYGGAATLLQSNLSRIGRSIGFIPRDLGFLPSLSRVLKAPPDLPHPASPRKVPKLFQQGIAFENVSFIYPGSEQAVLSGVSFVIRPGESLALVGHNGAGKTTIVKLLLRMYDPTEGRILLDGTDLREYDLDELRVEIGVIFQDFVRYELSAGENIGVGRLEALGDETRLLEAARKGGAGALIESLPEGLSTQLGRELGGRELSGGEWQKLALARAFLRDSQLLVLDEPTASLDVQTEYEVYARFHELTRDKVTLLISHRFSTVRMAENIIYLADGQVREEGSHEELMASNDEYARLYRLQSSQYLGEEASA